MNRDNKKFPSLPAAVRSAALAEDLPWKLLGRVFFTVIVSALLSGATLFGSVRPFPLAMIAAAEGSILCGAALAGALLGSLSAAEFPATLTASLLLAAVRMAAGAFLHRGMEEKAAPAARKRVKKASVRRIPGKRQLRAGRILSLGASENIWLRAAFACAAAMIAGAVQLLLAGESNTRVILRIFLSAAVTPAVTLGLSTLSVRQLSRTRARDVGMSILLFAAVRSLRDAGGIPFGADIAAAFAASLIAARGLPSRKAVPLSDSGRIMSGVLTGVLCGFAVDPGAPPFYAAAALAAGMLYSFSQAGAVLAGWVCCAAVAFAGGGQAAFWAIMPEVTVSSAILISLFHFRVFPAPSRTLPVCESHGAAWLSASVSADRAAFGEGRMRSLSHSFRSLSGALSSLAGKMARPSLAQLRELCEGAFDRRCVNCKKRALCRERECANLDNTVCRLSVALHREGKISTALIPPSLAARCHRIDEILADIEEESAVITLRARENDHSDVFAEEYLTFAQLLDDAAADTEENFSPDEEMSQKLRREMSALNFYAGGVTVYGKRRRRVLAHDLDLSRMRLENGEVQAVFEEMLGSPLSMPEYRIDGEKISMHMESIPRFGVTEGSFSRAAAEGRTPPGKVTPNGDCALHFETRDGRYYMLICDGMGSGGEASVTAKLSASFLEEILTGGAQMSAALTMLNSFLRKRNMECSAGIDLMEIDRYTGEAKFVKSGAAPSFVLREGRLFRLCSKTVPIGILRALDAEMIRFDLEAGDTIVMLSDGVSGNFEDCAWLCDMLASQAVMSASPAEIAQKIVRAAQAGEGRRDDITAAIVRVA